MTNPRIVLPSAVLLSVKPFPATPFPLSITTGVPAKSGSVEASMITVPVIVGSAEATVIVCGPAPAMLNEIVSVPPIAFASMIACRNEPAPLSAVLVTVNVASKPSSHSARTASLNATSDSTSPI